MVFYQLANVSDVLSSEAVASFQSDGIKPEFRLAVVSLDMNMGGSPPSPA
jgi:hypothetical protein